MICTHWRDVPSFVDMAPYDADYQEWTRQAIEGVDSPVVVEAGVRYGCSARIFADVLKDRQKWELMLVDPLWTPHAQQVVECYRPHVKKFIGTGQAAAGFVPDHSVDLLHIDADVVGDHPYEMSWEILVAFWNKIKPTGTIIMHDCTEAFPGILRLAHELEASGQWEAQRATPQDECLISAPCCLTRVKPSLGVSDFSVVVPVIKDHFLRPFLECVRANTVKPAEILVIDNSGKDRVAKPVLQEFSDLPVRYLPQKKNLGVNASWNLGIAMAKHEIVSVLNDDIVFAPRFFESLLATFSSVGCAGFVVPWTMPEQRLTGIGDGIPQVAPLSQREGWAFTIRKAAFEPIPKQFFTFCGDDFLYRKAVANGFWPLKITNNRIFHHVGISKDVQERVRLCLPTFDSERKAWQEMKKNGDA